MSIDRRPAYALTEPSSAGLTLTGEFQVVVADQVLALPHAVERLLAFLALTGHTVSRCRLAETLWGQVPERQAANSLRTALWRLRRAGTELVVVQPDRLRLAPRVMVDVAELSGLARGLIHRPGPAGLDRLPELVRCGELLPDWDDYWVVADRERFRLLRLEALESAAAALLDQGHFGDALLAALAAVSTEPLRESARRLVVQVHTAEGNAVEALRAYRSYRKLLLTEMGLEPSARMRRLVAPLLPEASVTDD